MHRNTNIALNMLAIMVGTFVANGVLEAAAPVYGWSDKHVIYYLKIMIWVQGSVQGFISWLAQAYNTDGSKPGDKTLTKVTESQPGKMDKEIIIETEKVTKRAE